MLRDYQDRALVRCVPLLRDARRVVLVLPTGGGKTYTAADLVRRLAVPTVWAVHRRELVMQAAETLRGLGLDVGIILAGHTPEPDRQVQVASIQTLARREHPPADLVVIDEAHHIRAATYARMLDQYPGVPVLGLTATPFRTDGKGLGDVFTDIVVGAYPDELVASGVLHEPRVFAPTDPDLSGVHVRRGEFVERETEAVMGGSKIVGDVLEHWRRLAHGMRTVVFGVNRHHTRQLVEAFVGVGVRAEYLDGTTPRAQRDAILHRLRLGYTKVVGNVMVLTEGWDLPALECAVVARPTASRGLHLQMIGRVMRSCDGKDGAIVLDHAGNHLRHGFVTDRLEYSLDDVPVFGVGGAGTAPGIRRCRVCFLMFPTGRPECPHCGWEVELQTRKGPQHVDGSLEELRREAIRHGSDEEHNARVVFLRIERHRIERGYKPGWTAFRMKARYGNAAWRLVGRFRRELDQGAVSLDDALVRKGA